METPDPTLVGNNFIIRYYTVLSRNPDALHHFYSDRSSRTFGNEDEESAPIKGIEGIKRHIDTHEFNQTQVLLSTVDCQGSANGGIFISVVGHISQGNTRKFTQTFFLEHMDDKYYVLNDIFRYLHTEEQSNGRVNDDDEEEEDIEEPEESVDKSSPVPTSTPVPTPAVSIAPQSQSATPAVQAPAASPAPPAASPASATSHAPAQKQEQQPPKSEPKSEQLPKSEQPHSKSEPTAPSHPNVANKPDRAQHHEKKESSKGSKSEGPKNWADVVKPHEGSAQPHHQKQAEPQAQQAQHSQPSQQTQSSQQHHSHSQPQQSQQAPSSHAHSSNQSPQTHKEPKSKAWPVLDKECSIYARALAYNTTAEQLREAFSPYGKVTNVVLKSSKGFAFIAFDSPHTVQTALDALRIKEIILPGQTTPLVIEQRKPSKHNAPVTLPHSSHSHSHGHSPSPHTPRGGRGAGGRGGRSPRVPRDDKPSSSSSSQTPAQSSAQQPSTQATQSQQQSQPQTQPQQNQSAPAPAQQQHQTYAPKRFNDRRSSSESTPPQRHFSNRQHSSFNNSNKPSV